MARTDHMNLRHWAALIAPPVCVQAFRRLRNRRYGDYEFAGYDWPVADSTRGWDVESVADSHARRWPSLLEAVSGTGPLTTDGVVPHNTLMCFGYALGRALQGRETLSMLDWGGGAGEYGVIGRRMYPGATIAYHCRDLSAVTRVGRQLFPAGVFLDSDDEALSRRYDFVMASGALHYAKDWRSQLRALAGSAERFVFITRQPFVEAARSFVVTQHPSRSGYYDTEYPGWFLNRAEFLEVATACGLTVEREFLIGEEPYVPGAPEQARYRGFLFRREA
jgi:putative methyltransferase (TIGR04325 family)